MCYLGAVFKLLCPASEGQKIPTAAHFDQQWSMPVPCIYSHAMAINDIPKDKEHSSGTIIRHTAMLTISLSRTGRVCNLSDSSLV